MLTVPVCPLSDLSCPAGVSGWRVQALGPGSAAPLRYLISVVEVQSQKLLRAIAVAEIALMPYSVIVLIACVPGWEVLKGLSHLIISFELR